LAGRSATVETSGWGKNLVAQVAVGVGQHHDGEHLRHLNAVNGQRTTLQHPDLVAQLPDDRLGRLALVEQALLHEVVVLEMDVSAPILHFEQNHGPVGDGDDVDFTRATWAIRIGNADGQMHMPGALHALRSCTHGVLRLPGADLALGHVFATSGPGGTPPAEARDGPHGTSAEPPPLNRVLARAQWRRAPSPATPLQHGFSRGKVQIVGQANKGEEAQQQEGSIHLPFEQPMAGRPREGVVA